MIFPNKDNLASRLPTHILMLCHPDLSWQPLSSPFLFHVPCVDTTLPRHLLLSPFLHFLGSTYLRLLMCVHVYIIGYQTPLIILHRVWLSGLGWPWTPGIPPHPTYWDYRFHGVPPCPVSEHLFQNTNSTSEHGQGFCHRIYNSQHWPSVYSQKFDKPSPCTCVCMASRDSRQSWHSGAMEC